MIAAPSYDNRGGGCTVLHQLCHLLNNITDAYVVPMPMGNIVNWLNHGDINQIVQNQKSIVQAFKTCPNLNTLLFTIQDFDINSFVAVYPEIVLGNPFRSTNIARWILYHGGFHTGINCIPRVEVEFKFEKFFTGSLIEISTMSLICSLKLLCSAKKNFLYCKMIVTPAKMICFKAAQEQFSVSEKGSLHHMS